MAVATIGKIISLSPIEGANRIIAAEVVCGKFGKWSGVVQIGMFNVGDLCEVYLQDCIVPQSERFAFMEKHKFIVRMARFKGVPSECLVMPLSEMSCCSANAFGKVVGADISELMCCTKYEKPLPANIGGDALGNFPNFIPKTDELNFQAAPHLVKALVGHPYYITEKADGSSATVYKYEGHFGCCSRNLELKETPTNSIWMIARQYHLEEELPDGIAIQFEVVGPGIQGNPMGLKQVEPRLFDIYDIFSRRRIDYSDIVERNGFAIKGTFGMPAVQIVEVGPSFPDFTDEELRAKAEGIYPNGKQREGIVIRPYQEMTVLGDRCSFKVINLRYKGG